MSAVARPAVKRAKGVSVAEFLRQQIALSDKSQREIASEIGYDNANVITMIKQGHTKLPINKIGLIAQSLGLDPRYLLRLVMEEYIPDTWAVIAQVMGDAATVSDEEMEVIGVMRQANGGIIPDVSSEENREAITRVTRECVSRDQASRVASLKRYDSLPPNARKR